MSIKKADCFLYLSGTSHNPNLMHLHIVCSDVDQNGEILLVSVRSCKKEQPNFDKTCILQKHEHPWLTHRSYIEYRKVRLVNANDLNKKLGKHKNWVQAPMNAQSFLKITKGFCESKRTHTKIRKYLNCDKLKPKPLLIE